MDNRLKLAALAVTMAAGLLSCASDPAETHSATAPANAGSANTPRPNIVVLFADDLGYGDLASYGHPNIATPNLDALGAAGQRWTNFYAPSPVCSPSRGALLTGRLPNRTGLYGEKLRVLFPDDPAGMPESETTLAEVLKTAGYSTAILGKWHLGAEADVFPTRHGFDYWFGLPYSNDMDWVGSFTFTERIAAVVSGKGLTKAQQAESDARVEKYADPKVAYWNVPLIRSSRTTQGFTDEVVEQPALQPTLTKRYTEEALAFIDRTADEPFFVYLPYTMPHTPLFASEEYQGKSRGGVYGDVIEEIDGSVGEIVAGLAERGLTENTLVVFTSDNGPWLVMLQNGGSAGLLRMGKGTTFEGGMRVPGIFSWPGKVAPGTVHDIGSGLDLMPTVLALAGLKVPAGTTMDGLDLSARLTGQGASPRESIPYYRQGSLYAWRQGPWKLHLIVEGAYGEGPAREKLAQPQLYDLRSDPAERFDVAERFPEVVARLRAEIVAHQQQLTSAPPLFDARLAAAARRETDR